MADPQDQAEALDDDRLNDEFPPEQPLGAEEYGVTAAEERYDEPLEERILREEPEVRATHGIPEDPPVLVDPDSVDGMPEDGSAVTRSVDDEVGAIDEDDPMGGDPTLRDVVTEREAPLAAEEAAIHIVDD